MGLVPQGNRDLERLVFWAVAASVVVAFGMGAFSLYFIWLTAQVVFVG